MPQYEIKPGDVEIGRKVIQDHIKASKEAIFVIVDGGSREWDALRYAVERYLGFQTALDVLNGNAKVQPDNSIGARASSDSISDSWVQHKH